MKTLKLFNKQSPKNSSYVYFQNESIYKAISNADKIVLGAGAGLTASAGINYNDSAYFTANYEPFLKTGLITVSESISRYRELNRDSSDSFWGFWAYHINKIFYQQKQLETYKLLFDIIKDKNYFIITTNTDGQFLKGGFDTERIFALQGSYNKIQCRHGCPGQIYDNEKTITNMMKSFDEKTLLVDKKEIPFCPECGKLMSPHLRVDHYFSETPYLKNRDNYRSFINATDENILFLEIGIGHEAQMMIQNPFEEMVKLYEHAFLVKIDGITTGATEDVNNKAIVSTLDIHMQLKLLKEMIAGKN